MYVIVSISDYHGGEFNGVVIKKTMRECIECSGLLGVMEDIIEDYLISPETYNCTEDELFEKWVKPGCAFGDSVDENGNANILRKLDTNTFETSESNVLYEEAYAEVKKIMHKRIKEE